MKLSKLVLTACLCAGITGTMFGMTAPAAETTDADKDYTITGCDWDYGDYVYGIWDEPQDKTSYKVQLYKSSTKVGSLSSAGSEHYDFTRLIISKGSGTYYYTVYPTKGGKNMAVKSEKLTIDSDMISYLKDVYQGSGLNASVNGSGSNKVVYAEPGDSAGTGGSTGTAGTTGTTGTTGTPGGSAGWKQDGKGWWYQNADGTWPANTWQTINNAWYYFGADGYMLHDTVTPDGYSVNSDGVWVH